MLTFLDHFGCPAPPHVQGGSILRAVAGEMIREEAIFGYFGKATNITDGRYVYMRNPVNADAGPLHAYTAMPIAGLNAWFPREVFGSVETGRYFGHTYDLPLYRIPVGGQVPQGHPGEASYVGRHQLFDTVADPRQETPLDDPAIEAHFAARLAAHLRACEVAPEQYTRLGLEG